MKTELDRLDDIAERLRHGGDRGFWVLSSGERAYVSLAANRADLLKMDGHTIVSAWARVGQEWQTELSSRWRYASVVDTE